MCFYIRTFAYGAYPENSVKIRSGEVGSIYLLDLSSNRLSSTMNGSRFLRNGRWNLERDGDALNVVIRWM
jgi:hypothetical protein